MIEQKTDAKLTINEINAEEIDITEYTIKMQKICDDSQLLLEVIFLENGKISALKITTRDSRFLNKYQNNKMGSYSIDQEKQCGILIIPTEKIKVFMVDIAHIAGTADIDATDKAVDNEKKKMKSTKSRKTNIITDQQVEVQAVVMDNEFARFELMLKSSLNISTSYSVDLDVLLNKIEAISENKNSAHEKFFLLVCAVFESYYSLNMPSASRFGRALKSCLDTFMPQVFDAATPTTPYQSYAVNRIARRLQVLEGVTGSLEWNKFNNPKGVMRINNYVKDHKNTDFYNWAVLKADLKVVLAKENNSRHDYAQELYLAVTDDSFLGVNFVLSFQGDHFWFDPESTISPKINMDYKDISKPILRLEKIENFDIIPKNLQDKILNQMDVVEWNKVNFDIQIIANDEQYQGHYRDRIDAIHAGVELLLKTLPENNPYKFHIDKLAGYLSQIAENCKNYLKMLSQNKLQNIDDYQDSLAHYTQFVISTLASAIGFSESETSSYLSSAEDFALIKKTRQPLCTLIKNKDIYSVMIDTALDPLSEVIKADFKIIKKIKNNEMKSDKYPAWFIHGLDSHQQDLLKEMLDIVNLNDSNDLNYSKTIHAISSKLRLIPILSNFGKHVFIICAGENIVEYPGKIRFSHIGARHILKLNLDESLERELRGAHAERNLEHAVMLAVNNKINELEENIKQYPDKFIDITGKYITDIEIPILFQTLITPRHIASSVDGKLHEDKLSAIAEVQQKLDKYQYQLPKNISVNFKIYQTNHPVNIGKIIDYTSLGSDNAVSINLMNNPYNDNNHQSFLNDVVASQFLLASSQKLNALINAYGISNAINSAFSGEREIYIAALSRFHNMLSNGICMGGCLSGKDREAIIILYTNAMNTYCHQYGELFEFDVLGENNQYRNNFAEIFAGLYCSMHLQKNAAQNTPGAPGIKTPDGLTGYLPQYLQDAINLNYKIKASKDVRYINVDVNVFRANNQLASNNIINIKSTKRKEKYKSATWKNPLITHDNQFFVPGNLMQWKILIDEQLCLKIIDYKKSERNQDELFYIVLLNSPHMSVEQKRIVLHALFNDLNKNIIDLVNYAYCAMGFICLSDAKAILEKSLGKIENSNKIIEITSEIQANSKSPSVKSVEEIKVKLAGLVPSETKENILNETTMTASKKSYLGVFSYCLEKKGSWDITWNGYNKAVLRSYACLNLLDTCTSEKQKLIIIYALFCVNGSNKQTYLQKKVLSNLGHEESIDGLEKAKEAILDEIINIGPVEPVNVLGSNIAKKAHQELMLSNHNKIKEEVKVFASEIADSLNNFPTLQILETIKVKLNEKFPDGVSKKVSHEFRHKNVINTISFNYNANSRHKNYVSNNSTSTTSTCSTSTTMSTYGGQK